jgi:menaquinone-dependent protoporphyrinogen oxidase
VVRTSEVLVVYATRHGSTREAAEAVAEALRTNEHRVTVRPAGMRGSIGPADLVVLGGAIYSGRWHRDAHRFLKRHRKELGIPVAVFGMGPRDDTQEAWQRSRSQLEHALAKRPWLKPASVAVFGGVDPPGREVTLRRDLRDWDAIRAWAVEVARSA